MESIYRSHIGNIERLMQRLDSGLDGQTRKQRTVMVAALIEGMMLFVGYGKTCPPGAEGVEQEVVALCMALAKTNASLSERSI